jgi:hypothetical protein
VVYVDKDGDGVKERKEAGFANITMTLQQLKRGKPSGRAQSVNSSSTGAFSFTNLTGGDTYQISEAAPRGYTITQPSVGNYTINLPAGQNLTGENFGNHKGATPARVSATPAATPFSVATAPVSSAASQTDASDLLFGTQDQGGIFAG